MGPTQNPPGVWFNFRRDQLLSSNARPLVKVELPRGCESTRAGPSLAEGQTMSETAGKQAPNSGSTTPCRGPLTEAYRPRTWADVVGQDKVIERIRSLAARDLAGRAYWLAGGSPLLAN
jgi:hypothetical protein